jgi:glycosyltransferase involved in cell wall biosynthesis
MGFVSSDPRKNSVRLIESIGLLEKTVPDVGLVLVCASASAKTLAIDTATRKDLRISNLTLLDALPREDLVALYNAAHILAFPSLYEGFGLPVIEAMACGTPVVTSNVSSLPEVAGDAAILVDPTDTRAIANALARVLTDQELYDRLVVMGRQKAATYSWDRTALETIAVYRQVYCELLNRRKAS